MTTYRQPAASETDADSPVTATLMDALANNPLSITELDGTAPKIKVSVETGLDPFTVDGLLNFDGVEVHGFVENISSGACNIQFALSTDGVTFSAAETFITITSAFDGSFHLLVDLATGAYQGAYQGEGAGQFSGTAAGGSASVSHLRITLTNTNHDCYSTAKRVGEII